MLILNELDPKKYLYPVSSLGFVRHVLYCFLSTVNNTRQFFFLQCEIHELLALVYYDSVQNVVPFFDQRFYTASLNHLRWMWRPLGTRHIAHPCPQIFIGQDISSLLFFFFRRLNCKSNNRLLQEWMYFLNKGSTIRVQYTIQSQTSAPLLLTIAKGD